MFWRWWKARRRRRILSQPFPEVWEPWLQTYCPQFPRLTVAEQTRLRQDVQLLVAEKHWEGCNGLAVTAEMQVAIASSAALMSLGFAELPFDRLLSILIYPGTFLATPRRRELWGLEEETAEPRLGEAWYQGPVILSWEEIERQRDAADSPRNLVIHEFAHLLDMANADVDGLPPLQGNVDARAWAESFDKEFRKLQRRLRFGQPTVLDDYAATSRVEFFAVGSEAFFAQPRALQEQSPALYELLQTFYLQDPARRS